MLMQTQQISGLMAQWGIHRLGAQLCKLLLRSRDLPESLDRQGWHADLLIHRYWQDRTSLWSQSRLPSIERGKTSGQQALVEGKQAQAPDSDSTHEKPDKRQIFNFMSVYTTVQLYKQATKHTANSMRLILVRLVVAEVDLMARIVIEEPLLSSLKPSL